MKNISFTLVWLPITVMCHLYTVDQAPKPFRSASTRYDVFEPIEKGWFTVEVDLL